MYKYCDFNDEFISLHDCHATKVLYDKKNLSFIFDDGICVIPGHISNKTDKNIYTGKACVVFSLETGDECDVCIYVFKDKLKKTFREEWKLSKLIDNVNNNKYSIEFLYLYKGYNSMIVECVLWRDEIPHHLECQLKISFNSVRYQWNYLSDE